MRSITQIALAVVLVFALATTAAAQNQASVPAGETTTTLKVNVRLVPVRVVVRDGHGQTVGNLTKDDFQVFDNGKSQTISQFSAEHYDIHPAESQSSSNQPASGAGRATGHYTVYLFDDLHLERTDLITAREAADKRLALLSAATERAAIFTTSGQKGIDFTADRAKLHEAVAHLEPRGKQRATDCPTMSYFLADLIADKGDEDALSTVTNETLQCAFDGNKKFIKSARQMAESAAREETATGRVQTQASLGILRDLVKGMAKAPGERTIIVVSSGFFVAEDPAQVDVLDDAIRANITINTLDPRGLVPSTDITQPEGIAPDRFLYKSLSDTQESVVLDELADGTGGVFFHNNNDVDEGFRRVATVPEYSYVLGFSPDAKFDGKLHKLKVALKNQQGMTVQARRGYFARKPGAQK
jgi:VWFA-related protein